MSEGFNKFRRHSGARPKHVNPESIATSGDYGFRIANSALKTRVNALLAASRNDDNRGRLN
jgi:hypothetical protein